MKLIEIAKFTDHVADMTEFYRRLFGTDPLAGSPDMSIFMTGQTKIFIHKLYEPGADDLKPENHIAFEVDNVDAKFAELQAQGLSIEIPPRDYYWGRSAYLRDPDGELIEITQSKK